MMRAILGVLTALCVVGLLYFIYSAETKVQPRFYIDFMEGQTEDEVAIQEVLQEAQLGETLFQMLEEFTGICENTVIVYGAPDGPLYNPETKEIWMPYSFAVDVFDRFQRYEYSAEPTEILQATVDVMEYVLLHEIGHALVHQLQLPIVGREEDAVDTLAALLLIDAYENGADIVIHAADSWGLMAADGGEPAAADYAGEHSLDLQRFHQTLCLIYGSNPEAYAGLAEKFEWSERRIYRCQREYEQKAAAWARLLRDGEAAQCEAALTTE